MKLQFSGHDSFICKHFWLKKGYDNEENAVIELGVGKNMVTAISYWLRAFGIVDNANQPTVIGDYIFKKDGVDPYLEDLGTIWLLHYSLIKTAKASIYNLFFNDFRKSKFEFTKDQFATFIKRKLEGLEQKNFTANTLNTDLGVFIRTYLKPDYKGNKIDVEDDFANLMVDLQLMDSYQSENVEGKLVEWYKVESNAKVDLPWQIVLFTILDNDSYGNSISFRELLGGYNSPGSVFALNEDGLYSKLESITQNHKSIVYTESAGVRELQLKSKVNKWNVLNEYYKN
jgi:hypothetical protein